MTYAIRITRSSGEQTLHPLTAAQTTVGSDQRSDVCITGEASILPQHILLAPKGEQCWVSTTPGSPVWDKDGAAVEGAYLAWGSRLTVGRCALELIEEKSAAKVEPSRNPKEAAADKAGESSAPPSERVHPGIFMLLIVTLAFSAFQLVSNGGQASGSGLSEAPQLFADAEVTCRGENPGHRAITLEEQALAKSERSVFDLQDGIEAVALYREAQACFSKGGQTAEAAHVAEAGTALRASLAEQYDLLRLRLSRDLSSSNRASAKVQVRRLSELLRHKADSNYALSLRRLSARLAKQGSSL